MDIILMKIEDGSSNGYKTLWGKEKLLVTSNFSFSHSFFQKTCTANTLKQELVLYLVRRHNSLPCTDLLCHKSITTKTK